MRKTAILSVALFLSAVLAIGPYASKISWAAETIVLTYADPGKEGMSRTKAAKETMLEIEKRTGGRVKHKFYWAQSLLKAKDVLKGLQAGTADVGDATAVVYHKSRFPVWQFIQLLFVGGNDQYAVTKACNELYQTIPILKKEFDKEGVQLLSTNAITPTIIMSKAPLREPEDFKGVRIRTVGPVAKFVAAMGAAPNPMKFYEIPEALARGVLDATQSYIYASYAYKHYEHVKYLNLTGLSHIIVDYWINMNTLKKMPQEIRKIYLETWREYFPRRLAEITDAAREKQIKKMKEAGVTFYSLTPEQLAKWKKIAEPINEAYFKKMEKMGIDGRKIVAEYQALYKKYERK